MSDPSLSVSLVVSWCENKHFSCRAVPSVHVLFTSLFLLKHLCPIIGLGRNSQSVFAHRQYSEHGWWAKAAWWCGGSVGGVLELFVASVAVCWITSSHPKHVKYSVPVGVGVCMHVCGCVIQWFSIIWQMYAHTFAWIGIMYTLAVTTLYTHTNYCMPLIFHVKLCIVHANPVE